MDEKERLAKAEAEAAAAREAQAKAEAAAAEANAALAKFAEQQRADRHAGYVQFAEAALAGGKLDRPDAAALPAVLSALDDASPVEFAEAGAIKKVTPVEWLKKFVAKGATVVQFGEFAAAGGPDADAGSAKGKTDHEIDAAAKAYAAKNNVQYMDALRAVVGFTA